MDFTLVLSSCPGEDLAKKIGKILVEKRLAACIHISSPIKSLYYWEGKFCEEEERQIWIKTKKSLLEPLKQEIRRLHPFQVPEFLSIPINEGLDDYLHWIDQQTRPNND